jgi:hypothetical protein
MSEKLEITPEFLKSLHSHVCNDVQRDLEQHYPQVFRDTEIKVGYYRDIKGVLHVLGKDQDSDYRLLNPQGFVVSYRGRWFFSIHSTDDLDELRSILSGMTWVENP